MKSHSNAFSVMSSPTRLIVAFLFLVTIIVQQEAQVAEANLISGSAVEVYECDGNTLERLEEDDRAQKIPGTIITLCFVPSDAALNAGATIQSVDDWLWETTTRGGESLSQIAVEDGSGDNILSIISCNDICLLQSMLPVDFYEDTASVLGSGNATLVVPTATEEGEGGDVTSYSIPLRYDIFQFKITMVFDDPPEFVNEETEEDLGGNETDAETVSLLAYDKTTCFPGPHNVSSNPPPPDLISPDVWYYEIKTTAGYNEDDGDDNEDDGDDNEDNNFGRIVLEIHREWAPLGADRFFQLVSDNYYDCGAFFRVVPDFVVQWGIASDPTETSKWDIPIEDDPVGVQSNTVGMVSFATAGPNTRTTQIFVNTVDNTRLDDSGFAPFAKVVNGMDLFSQMYVPDPTPDQSTYTSQGNAWLLEEYPNVDIMIDGSILSMDMSFGMGIKVNAASSAPTAASPSPPPPDEANANANANTNTKATNTNDDDEEEEEKKEGTLSFGEEEEEDENHAGDFSFGLNIKVNKATDSPSATPTTAAPTDSDDAEEADIKADVVAAMAAASSSTTTSEEEENEEGNDDSRTTEPIRVELNYSTEAYLCNPVDGIRIEGSNRPTFNQGGVISICVKPDDASIEAGVRLNNITEMEFVIVGNDSIKQEVVKDGQNVANGLSDYSPTKCYDKEWCAVSTMLLATFYKEQSHVISKGTANIMFPSGESDQFGLSSTFETSVN